MAGIPQDGLLYASIPSTFFDNDPRIDKLLDAQGWRGVGVYLYLRLRACGSHGYYVEWCYADCATTARKMGGGISARQVEEAIRCCTQVGLYDGRLLEEWGVLTNIDIQQNYLEAIRRARRKVQIVSEYWLLAKDELTNSLVSWVKNAHECNINGHDCNKDDHKCYINDPSMNGMNGMSSTTTTTNKLVSSASMHEPLLLSSEDMEIRKKKYGPAINQWERIVARGLSAYELDKICELVNQYGGQWVIDAMAKAGDNGKQKLGYVQGVLSNWQTGGREAKKQEDTREDIRTRLLAGMEGEESNG